MANPQTPNPNDLIDPNQVIDLDKLDAEEQEQDAANLNAEEKAAADKADADKAAAEDDEGYFEEVDLGNGEKLTFDGKTPEEVRDKVLAWIKDAAPKAKAAAVAAPAKAANETARPAEEKPAAVKKTLSQDEEFAIDNEFKNGSPRKALNDFMVKQYGMSLDEVVEQAREGGNAAISTRRANREISAVAEFREKHPEYEGTVTNRTAMELWLKAGSLEATAENLEKGYVELTAAGVIKPKAAEAAPKTENKTENKTETKTETKPLRRSQASGLFGKQGTPGRRDIAPKKGASDAEVYKAFNEGGSDAVLAKLQESLG